MSMEFKAAANPEIRLTLDGKATITLVTTKSAISGFEQFKDKELMVKVDKFSQRRSLSQNAYMWTLLDQIGIKIGLTKEEVYKNYIKDYGVFEIIPIKNEAANRFIKNWSSKGLGWFCEDIGESKLKGYTKLIAYFGSSTYTSNEMRRVVDAIVQECGELGINTMSLSDIMLLRNENDS